MSVAEATATFRRRRLRRAWIAAAVVAVVVIAAAVGVVWWSAPREDVALPARGASPEQVVLAYTRAVAARDFETANAIDARGGDIGRFDRPLSFVHLTDIDTREEGDTAYVSFAADARHHDISMDDHMVWGFYLERATDGRWQIVDAGVG